MKKVIVTLLAISALTFAALGIAACGDEQTHTVVHHVARSASCEEEGNEEYWYCEECEKYYVDQECKKEVSYFDVIIPALGHDLQDVAEKPATCTESGNTAGLGCTRCDYFTAQIIPALGHDMTYHAEEPATCTESGAKEHWTCSREEGVYYADGNGDATLASIFLVPLGHEMTHVEMHTYCTENGNVDHWVCAHEPNVYYRDEDATETIDDIVIQPIGHDWADEWETDENYHWHVCNNGCGELGSYENHRWDDGLVTKEATTANQGEKIYTCEDCRKERTEILPRLGTYSFTVEEIDLYENRDGGTVDVQWDGSKEGEFYVENTVITVTVTADVAEGFAIGAIRKNGELLVDSPLCKDGVYTYSFAIKENIALTVEFGKPITTNRTWKLNDGNGHFAYPWEYYTVDAAQDGNGTAVLLVYDVTGIDDVRAHDFSADPIFFSYNLYQTLNWSDLDAEIRNIWVDWVRQHPEEELQNFTLAFAIRLMPSDAKRLSGYVGSDLILPVDATVGGIDYGATKEYSYPMEDLVSPNEPQFSINSQGSYFEFLRTSDGNGSVFNKYNAAYIEIEMRNGEDIRYAYLFAEGGKLNMYSSLDKSGTPLACADVSNAYVQTSSFNSWAAQEYPDAGIIATVWEFRTKVHVDENSAWIYEGDWSDVIKYNG